MYPIAKAESKLAYKERRVQLQLIDCRVSTASRHCFSDDVCKYILLHLDKIATVQVFYFFVKKHVIFLLYIECKKLLLCSNFMGVEKKYFNKFFKIFRLFKTQICYVFFVQNNHFCLHNNCLKNLPQTS